MKKPKSAPPGLVAFLIIMCPVFCLAQRPPAAPEPQPPPFYGPWNAVILPGGDGLHATLNGNDTILNPESPWTLLLWVNAEDAAAGRELIAGVGAPNDEYPRYLAIAPGKVELYLGKNNSLEGPAAITPGKWHMLAATFDGVQFRLYADEARVAEERCANPANRRPVQLSCWWAPRSQLWKSRRRRPACGNILGERSPGWNCCARRFRRT